MSMSGNPDRLTMPGDAERLDAAAMAARQELARRCLPDFLALLQPGYERAAHADLLSDHLAAVEAGELNRLIVQLPPRSGKSLHVSQALPAWALGRDPRRQIILSSYSSELAQSHSRRARGFVADPRFPFADVRVDDRSRSLGRWNTTAGGGLIATGIGGAITGFGADVLVIDDPVKGREEADSQTIRDGTWTWFGETAMTRLQPRGAVVVAMTRWHADDLVGRILDSKQAARWTTLNLAASAGENDPLGRAPGEALWPAWFDLDHLARQRETLGSRAFQALYQGAPTPDGGAVFRREWMAGKYDRLPDGVRIVQAVDSSFKTGTGNDYSVIATWATDTVWFYLVDMWRAKVEFPDLVKAIREQAREHRPSAILVEDSSAGSAALPTLKRETNLPVVGVIAKGSKVSRAEAVSPLFESGKVLLPSASPGWLHDWTEEHAAFPAGKHDDQVDTTSMALTRLRGSRSAAGVTDVCIRDAHGNLVEPELEPGGVSRFGRAWLAMGEDRPAVTEEEREAFERRRIAETGSPFDPRYS